MWPFKPLEGIGNFKKYQKCVDCDVVEGFTIYQKNDDGICRSCGSQKLTSIIGRYKWKYTTGTGCYDYKFEERQEVLT